MRIVIKNKVCYIYKIDEFGRETELVAQYPVNDVIITTKTGNHSLDTMAKAGGYQLG